MSIFWKVYFWAMVAVVVFGLATLQLFGEFEDPASFSENLKEVVLFCLGFVGLYGYAWSRRIGRAALWKIFFVVVVAFEIWPTVQTFATLERDSMFLWVVGVMVLLLSPYYLALFLYAFRSKSVWVAA